MLESDKQEKDQLQSRNPAHQPVADSYAQQWYRVTLNGVDYEIRPTASDELDHLPIARCFIISAWNPRGAALTFEENQNLHKKLRTKLESVGGDLLEAVTFAADGSWFESAWFVQGLKADVALDIAAQFEQLAIVRWDREGLHVLPLDSAVVPASTTRWTLTRLESRPCPMKLLERDSECTPAGGPWVSKSMAVGAVWHEHRRQVLSLVGCGVCDSGQRPLAGSNGQPILLSNVLPSSRFGGASFKD